MARNIELISRVFAETVLPGKDPIILVPFQTREFDSNVASPKVNVILCQARYSDCRQIGLNTELDLLSLG